MDDIDQHTINKRYVAACAHSRRVTFLRYALPIAALCLFMMFVIATYVRTLLPDTIAIESSAIQDGYIVMNAPTLEGQNADNLPYRLKAARAMQKLGDNSSIRFENINAELPLKQDEIAQIEAQEGVLDQTQNRVVFTKPFRVETSDGMIAEFEAGEFDMSSSGFTSDKKVQISFDGGTLTAQSMVLEDGGEKMRFDGGVKMRISHEFAKGVQ